MKLVIAITGASGSIYAARLISKVAQMPEQVTEVGIVASSNADKVWQHELGGSLYNEVPFKIYGNGDFDAPFASGSAGYNCMIVIPCSMGTLGKVAAGISSDLCSRAADVMLKERKKLIMVVRETPYNLIHINNMHTLTQAGAVICPATPSYYSKPANINALADTVVDRVLHLAGFNISSYSWQGTDNPKQGKI